MADHDPQWLLEQAWLQVGRATTSEDRARALSTFRRAIHTATKHAGDETPELLERIRQLEEVAGALYAEVADQHVRKAIRALGSLRMAVEARLDAKAGGERMRICVTGCDGHVLASWEADVVETLGFYGVPPEHYGDRIEVQLMFTGEPDVRAYRGRKIVWRKPSPPSEPAPTPALQ